MSSKKISKNLLILMALIFAMLVIPVSFASDNLTDTNTISLNQSSDASQMAIDDSGSLGDAGDKSIYVSTAGSDTEGSGSSDSPYATVGKALNEANGNQNLIFISNGTYKENNLIIKSNVNITGLGDVTIDGNDAGGIFTVSGSATIALKNLTFINAKSAKAGGVINIPSGFDVNLYVDSVDFINNTASNKEGGVIYDYGGKSYNSRNNVIFISNSNFIGNAANYGAALVVYNAVITNSTFVNNKGTYKSGWGGAIRVNNNANITGCIFINNSALDDGGAIGLSSGVTSIINYNVFINNTAKTCYDIYTTSTKVNIDYNWWNTNDRPTDHIYKNMKLNNYIVLMFTNVGSTLYAKLNSLDTGDALPNPELLPVRDVIFTGDVNPTTAKTVNGIASTTYSSTTPITATVSVDGVTMSYAPLKTVYVDSVLGNDNDNDGTPLKPFLTIQKAVNSVANSGTIILNGNFKGTGNTNITINNDLTFTSKNGATVDGEKTSQLFNIASGNVNFTNLNLINGFIKGNGGAIAISGGLLTINNVTFVNNTNINKGSSKFGGAIYSISDVDITNSKFINSNGYDNGGSVYIKDGNLFVVNTNFENNIAASGAAIYMSSKDSNAYVNGCEFVNNDVNILSTSKGAAIYTNGKLTVLNSKFINNTAKSNGGAIYASNKDANLSIENSVFNNNKAGGDGGAVYALSNVNIKNSEFVENTAVKNGGAIGVSNANITSSLFEKNSASNGGAIYAGGNLDISYTVLVNNKISGKGMAIYGDEQEAIINVNTNWWGTNINPKDFIAVDDGTQVILTNWIVMSLTYERFTVFASLNSLNTGDILSNPELFYTRNVTFAGNVNPLNGTLNQKTKIATTNYLTTEIGTVKATIDNQELSVTIVAPIPIVYVNAIDGNDLTGDGSQGKPFKTIDKGLSALANNGKLILDGTFKGIGNTNITVDGNGVVNVTIIGVNNAVIDGEKANWLLNVKKGSLFIYNLTLTNAYSINHGAAISLSGTGTITVANVTFSNNNAYKQGYSSKHGGAIYTDGLTIVGDNTIFINNNAEYWAGAIYGKDIVISGNNVLFDSNHATSYGGAIYGTNLNITGTNIKFVNNVAGTNGGAIYISRIVNILSNGIIFDNNTGTTGGAIYSGAQLFIYGNNTIFVNNDATTGNGGAIYNANGVYIIGHSTKFINNTAKNSGGAIYVNSGAVGVNITGNNTLFENNSVSKQTSYSYGGGAIKATATYITGENTKFISNSAGNGGAISVSGSNIISVSGKNTQFSNNTASASGGAIYARSKIDISNSLFDGNSGKDSGAIYLYTYNGNINYCAFTGNSGTSTIYAYKSTSSVRNFDNNWWSSNNPDFAKLISGSDIAINNYAVLNFTSSESTIQQGESVALNINAYWNGTTSQDKIGNIPFNKVYLTAADGSLKEIEGNLVDGKFTTEFSADKLGTFDITSKLDDEVQNINITVEGASGTVLYVSKTGNDNNDGFTRVNPLLTINKAVEIARNNKNITKIMVGDGVYDVSELTIGLSIAIVGQSQSGTIINGNGKRIFVFTDSAKVNLTSLTLRNAANTISGGDGGAITNNGKLIVSDCAFINNTASEYGGAIDNQGSLTIISSLFVNNTADKDAGAVSSAFSLYSMITASLTITNSTFINNTAARNGGAIKVYQSSATITDSTFDGNNLLGDLSGSYGGAVYGWKSDVSVYNSAFTNNNIKANGQGGAIFVNGASNTFDAYGLIIINNSAATGSACYFDRIKGSLSNSIILDNTGSHAVDGSGSVVVNNNWWGNTNTNTTFNTGLVNGISVPSEWLILNLTSSTNNIFVKDSVDVTIDLTKTQLGNTVDIPGMLPVTITTTNGNVNTTTATLINGKAIVKYTAVNAGDEYLYAELYGIKVSIEFNISAIPHIIYVDAVNGNDANNGNSWNDAVKTIKHALTLLNENKDAIYLAKGTYSENALAITKSVSIVGFGNVTVDGMSTGGIFTVAVDNLDVEFRNINFVNGKITENMGNGGAICIAKGFQDVRGGTAVIDNCTFKNCYAPSYGGAIHNTNYKLLVNNSVFEQNSGVFSGAVCIMGGEASIMNSVFVNNVASSQYSSHYGGAIRVQSGKADITHCVFMGNEAISGSAIMVFSSATGASINYCIFEDYPANVPVIANENSKITVDANYNYFGTNVNPVNLTSGNMNLTYWTVLGITPEVSEIIAGESVKLNIDFTKYTDGTGVYVLKEAMPALTVTLKPTIGVVSPTTVICESGIVSVNYVSPIEGNEVISINAPEYVGNLNFTVVGKASPIIYVDAVNGVDTNKGNSWDDAVRTIKHALSLVTEDRNIIYLADGVYNENGLVITKSVSIIGFGNVTADGENAGNIFTIPVNNLNVEFKNINFVNGKITGNMGNGAAICIENNGGFVSGGTLLINNCTFVNNTVGANYGYGGAIYNTRYDLTINNSVFVNNSAPWNGAVANTGGNLLVLNSVFVNNVASSNVANWGGAIRSNGGILNVTKSVFINNVASKGSAIMVASSVTKANINYCIFEGYNTTIPVIESNIKTITVDANYNYFGTNVNPVNLTSGNMNLAYWTVLGVTPEVGEIIAGESVKLNIDFTKYTDGTGVYVLKEAMPALTVTLKPTIGVVNPTTVICENGIASVNYTSPVTGKEIIYINAPEQVGTLEFNVLSKEINTIYVSPNGDDSNKGTKDSPLKTLDAAITKNHEYGGGKTIYLFDGNYIASNLNITDNVTVIGQSKMAIVDAKSKTFITTSDVSVNILNLTIKDAVNGIINNGDMAIENVLFSGNNVAILNNKKLTVEDADFINNNGAIVNTGNSIIKQSNFDNDNRAISSTAGSVTAISSKFVNNKDSGIYIENSTLSLANNVMENNNVANIYIKSGSIVSNVNVVFLNNKTVRAQNNDSIVIGAAITDDAGNTITGGNITFTANGKVLGTAGIVDGIANYTITNIANGIYTISGTSSIGFNLIIKTGILNVYSASWFIGNVGYETLADAVSAAKDGDVIEGLPGIYRYSEPVEINKNIIIKNRGQGEVILDASLNKDNYIVYQIGKEYINNILRIPQRGIVVGLYNLTFINAYNQGHGGAVYNHGILSVYNCTFINNTVVGDPDYDFNYGGAAIFNYNGQLTISDSYFVNNTGYEGGAIYAAADSDVVAILDINNTKFENNAATTVNDGGGAIYAGNYLKLIVNNTEFIANKAPTKNPKIIAGGTGGAIYIRSTIESLIENSNFVNNSAFYWGGAIKSYGAKFNITNCNFTGNYAGASGGALHFGRSSFGSDISTMINNCLFSNNDAGSIISAGGSNNRGGAICVEGIIAVYNSIFYKNTAVDGGAIYAGFVNSIIDNCTFIANSAVNGGAVNNYHNSLNISNSYFERNIASYGGAIVNYQTYGYANFLNNTYKDNSAAYGGAIYSTKGFNAYSLDVLYSEFVNNSASADGNEIYVIGNANINYNSFVNSIPVSIQDSYVDAKSVNYVSIENNWWGTSNPDWDKILSDTNVSIPKVYAVLNGTLEESGIATYDLIINMYWNGTKNQTNISNIPARLVKLNATGGSFSIDEGKFVNGVFDSEFTAKTIKQFIVIASIDNEVIKFNCTNLDTSSVNVTVTGGDSLRDTVISVVVSPNNATGNVTFNIAGKDYVIDLVNGKGNITISDLPVGEYSVNVTYNGDNNYYPSSTVAKLNITFTPKTSVNVAVNKGDDPRDNVISVIVDPKEVTGNVTVNVDGKEYIVDLVNAKANITVSNLTAGEHTVNVTYNGDKNYDSSYVTVKFNETFSPIVNLTVADLEKYFGGSEKLEAVLTDCLGKAIVNGTVIFTINGKDYVKYTNENGSAFMSINLVPGKYNITVKFNGTKYYDAAVANATATVKSTVIGHDIVKMFRNSTQYSALFLDSNGNPLANATVKFNINGVFYTKITNSEGIATLNIQLLPKEYIITNYNLVTGEENSNKVTVKSLLVDNHNLVKYYLNESSYTLKVIGKDGKVAAGQEVTFNINGVFYHRVSDDNGIVSLGIKLHPGNYIVTAEYEGCWVSNNITVLPTLITKDLDMKYLDGSNFTAQTLDGQGKPLANQNVSFNVNGVFYHKTTDEKGIANLNIRLNPGKYIITSIWNEYQVGNNITIV